MKKYKILLSGLMILAISLTGFVGCSNGEDGADGKNGIDGKDGTSIVWKGSLDSAPANPEYMWAYYDNTTGCSYVWDGTQWNLLSGSAQKTFDVEIAELTDTDVPLHSVGDSGVATIGEFTLSFMSGKKDIPYLRLTTAMLKELFEGDYDYSVSAVDASTTEVVITNTLTNATAVFDLTTHTCIFNTYDEFFRKNEKALIEVGDAENGGYMCIADADAVAGQIIGLDWSTQDIGVVIAKTESGYSLALPLQTFSDIFNLPIVYNGTNLYLGPHLQDSEVLQKDYYDTSSGTGNRSEALAEYCYNELCMNLDFNYGLKAIHGIESFPDFNTYFASMGIRDDLRSTDPKTFATALRDVCEFYFGDGHSNYLMNSFYLGNGTEIHPSHTSAHDTAYVKNYYKYIPARKAKYATAVPAYEVTADGKTAIVRFDSFTWNQKSMEARTAAGAGIADIAEVDITDKTFDAVYDTIDLIHAVNAKIQTDSSIENVILDLSCNGGGAVHSAEFVIAWMLGSCDFNNTNALTGAKSMTSVYADVNFDGTYDELSNTPAGTDSVKGKNLFCLVSPLSFSCGNAVPAILKASGAVTIIGVTSGGGTSVVHPTSAADGTVFRISSKYVMSVSINGSNYDIDKGVEPHYYINQPANFYDKAKLQSLVNNINELNLAAE